MPQSDASVPAVERTWISGRNGGKRREVFVPNAAMREVHEQVISRMRRRLDPLPESSYGAVRGRSALDCARRHQFARFVYKLDLFRAYPSVRVDWVKAVLQETQIQLWMDPVAVEEFARGYLMMPGGIGLMTGTPAAPDLFNRVAANRLDEQMLEFAERWDLTYTRYLDDLVFSSEDRPIVPRKRQAICEVVRRSGFRINYRKTGYYDLAKRPVLITGFMLGYQNDSNARKVYAEYGLNFVPRIFSVKPRWLEQTYGLLYCFSNGINRISAEMVEGRMGVMRGLSPWSQNHTAKRIWRLYFAAVRSKTRPRTPLSEVEQVLARL